MAKPQLVMENQQIVGIVTERDYARKVILMGQPAGDLTLHSTL
jgi:hypothetical protein